MAALSTIAAVVGAVAAVAGTAYSIATAPSVPPPPKPPAPPPIPPGVPAPPPLAPTVAEADAGIARQRRERSRAFGLDQTILNTPTLGGGPATGRAGGPSGTGLGRGSIF